MHKKPDMSLEVRSYSDVLEFFPGNLSICVLIFWSFKDSDFPTVFPGNVSICVLLHLDTNFVFKGADCSKLIN